MTSVLPRRGARRLCAVLPSGALLAALLAGCSAQAAPPAAPAAAPDHALAARPPDPTRTEALLRRARELARPGTVVQTDGRLGVPTFLWTRDRHALQAGTRRALLAGVPHPQAAAARAALADHAALYGLGEADVAGAVVANVHDRGGGAVVVKLRNEVGGVEVFGEELNVVMDGTLEPVAMSGYLTSAATPPARAGGLEFRIGVQTAAAAALGQLAKAPVEAAQLAPAGARDGWELFTLRPPADVVLDEPLRARPVYFHLPAGLEAGWHVEVHAQTGPPPAGVLAADGEPLATPEAFSFVLSAVTGEVLFRKDLTADALPAGGFTYRVWADPVTGVPFDSPAGNGAHPKATPAPDGAQAPFVAPQDVTLPHLAFSRNDPWLAPGATETRGNNVDAYLNLFSPDGIGNPTTTSPADPPNGDYRAQVTAPGQFLHAQIPDANGALAEGRQGAIQQVFYDLNFLHDWYYDAGFDEAAGNAQTDNFGRGGVANDSIRAQIQDFSGYNNANMTTGADGVRPRMRMYGFQSPANRLELAAPASIAGLHAIGVSMSGPQTFDVTASVVRATFSNTPSSCTVTNAAALAGQIAMFDFDNTDGTGCSFTTRISRLTANTTASAILMVYTSGSPSTVASITGFVSANTRPVAIVSWNTAQVVKATLALPSTVTARLYRAPDRDGALDNQIVFHEWFHYASNRLVGNGTGLGTNQAAGLGEGWSDFSALLLTVREDDTATPGNATFGGAYALSTFVSSGAPYTGAANQGYYFGVRRYPYSTDLALNPLTFRHVANGVALPPGPPVAFGADGANNAQVHNAGEVWATMLWECYAGLLRDTIGGQPRLTFAQAQDRMRRYLIAALKATPTFPTLTEARDALLAVALASDPTDYVAFRVAFAKRGAGPHAVAPDRFSTDNSGVVEDFTSGPDLAFESATLDDALGACDADGVLDRGEYGRLTITLRNSGTVPLSATTATVTALSPDVWFPTGATVAFPATPPAGTASASLRVAYSRGASAIQVLDLRIDYDDADLAGPPPTRTVSFRAGTDEVAGATATDSVEAANPPWTPGFATSLGDVAPWRRVEATPLSHHWHVDDPDTGSDQLLTSPVFTVDAGGVLGVAFDHDWSFEFDGGGNYDGGVVEMSVNAGAFVDIGASAYNGTILNYTGNVNPLRGRAGFVQSSGGTVHTTLTQAVAPGSTVQVRFRAASDGGGGGPGWNVDDVAFTGVVERPFASVVPDADACALVPASADLAIVVTDGVSSVAPGGALTYTITATNQGDAVLGATVADAFPADLACSWTCAAGAGAACGPSGASPGPGCPRSPTGGAVTHTASCTVAAAPSGRTLSNSASITPPGPVIDPSPSNNTATDVDVIRSPPAHLTATQTVAGSFIQGGTVTYTIVLANGGPGKQPDNPGDELVDVLPDALTLVAAGATAGTVTTVGRTVRWNGELDPGASATLTLQATIGAAPGTTVSSQATFHYDAAGDGINGATGTTEAYACQ